MNVGFDEMAYHAKGIAICIRAAASHPDDVYSEAIEAAAMALESLIERMRVEVMRVERERATQAD